MPLVKWCTNSTELKERLKGTIEFTVTKKEMDSELTDVTKKALGILWDPVKDEFMFNTKHMENEVEKTKNAITKRTLFSLGSKIFDPVGYVLPTTMQARLVMQRIWADPTKWDEYVTPQILKNWNMFIDGLKGMETVRIPRWTGIDYEQPNDIHIFCDASEDAYAAVAYQVQGNKSTLLASKARVAPSPKRSTTIPRLELLANLIASKLAKYLKQELGYNGKIIIWTDSMISVGWIKSEEQDWPQWVQNRVMQIKEAKADLKFCPGIENPADLPSRGTAVKEINQGKWWNGPQWLVTGQFPEVTTVQVDRNQATMLAKKTQVNTIMVKDKTKLKLWVKKVSDLDTALLRQSIISRAVRRLCKKPVNPTTRVEKFKNKEFTINITPPEDLRGQTNVD
jgi:hypothetical protein